MRGQLIAQAAKAACAAIGRLLAQLADFANERINLLLLLKNGLIQLLHQVLGKARLDFKVHQTFVNVGVWHSLICVFCQIMGGYVRKYTALVA